MQTRLFLITHRGSQRVAGAALVALEARYLTVNYFNAPRLDRRFANSDQWKEIRWAFSMGLPTSVFASDHVLHKVLVGENGIEMQVAWLSGHEMEIETPEHAVSLLDDLLLRQCATLKAPALRLA